METRLLVQCLELLLRPAFSGFYWVLIEVTPSGLDRLRSDVVDFSSGEQLQRTRHKSLAACQRLLFDEKGSRRELGSVDHRVRDRRTFGSEVLVVILQPQVYSGACDRIIQQDKIRVISDYVSTISGLGLSLFIFHDCLQSSHIVFSYFNFGIDTLEIRTRQSRFPLEMKVVQVLQLGCQMERQFMR